MDERTIFLEALDKDDPSDRSAFLDTACAGDDVLRLRVEALLKSHVEAGSFLGRLAPERVAEELAFQHANDETQGETPENDKASADLGFLTPADKPDVLGRLGHYDILEVIGRGGMGIVLRALDEKLHRVVAIKVMAAQLATNATARKRFTREAQAAAAVTHDHIVTIHAVEESDGLPYLVMQYVSGLSLQQRLDRSGPLELREIVRIGLQMAGGLAAAHAQGLIHRDIKPANILLENGVERVKITDFGLARAVADASLTQSGVVAGTPQYMSPEQARGDPVDQRTDLFSLGSVLYAMCAGRPPFRATTGIAVLKRVCEDTPSPINETNPEIPVWLAEIVTKLQAKDAADRFQSAAEVAELLGRHLAHLQHPSVVGPVVGDRSARTEQIARSAVAQPGRHRRRWAMAAAALLLCLIGGLGFSEATGVTSVRATVIRIFTPEGTPVVETDDPGVKVTIESDGGLVITGAGLQEVRLKPGSYKVKAAKDGKPVRLDQELVTITRGDKQVVRVRLEGEAIAGKIAAKGEPGAFVLLGDKGLEVRKFGTLAAAVKTASDGDTIEVRGNGPFVTGPIDIGIQALRIQAGNGYRPVIRLRPEDVDTNLALLSSRAQLVLEGLDLQRMNTKEPGNPGTLVYIDGAPLFLANCRLFVKVSGGCVLDQFSPIVALRNCEFLTSDDAYLLQWSLPSRGRWSMENCVSTGGVIFGFDPGQEPKDLSIQFRHNTLLTNWDWVLLAPETMTNFPKVSQAEPKKRIRVESSGNALNGRSVLSFHQTTSYLGGAKPFQVKEIEALLSGLFDWKDRQNLYSVAGKFAVWSLDGKPTGGLKTLIEWNRFWGQTQTKSLAGHPRYQGGNLAAKRAQGCEQLTPADWRLRPDSPGYRGGRDGKDLGADLDLVGPGPAYERWKKTPDYQQWLKDSEQAKK